MLAPPQIIGARRLASQNNGACLRLAEHAIQTSRAELRDVYLYRKPKPPPGRREPKGARGISTVAVTVEQLPKMTASNAPRCVRTWRQRPWLSARELRDRAREEMREAQLPYKHEHRLTFQTLSGGALAGDHGPSLRAKRRVKLDVAKTPRELFHIKRAILPPIKVPPSPRAPQT
jgi:hypothetical protein